MIRAAFIFCGKEETIVSTRPGPPVDAPMSMMFSGAKRLEPAV